MKAVKAEHWAADPALYERGRRPSDAVDDAEALIEYATAAFKFAAKQAVAENDSLGITTHGAIGGQLVERQPRSAGIAESPPPTLTK